MRRIIKTRQLEPWGIASLFVSESYLELKWRDSGERGKDPGGVTQCRLLSTQVFSASRGSVLTMDALRASASSLSWTVRIRGC